MAQSAPMEQTPRALPRGGGGFRLTPFEAVTLVALLIAGGFGGYTLYAGATDLNKKLPTPPTFIPAVRTTLTSSVTATGTAQSSQQVSLTFDVGQGGGKIQTFLVKLGDQVTAGQPLAKLDDADLAQALRSAESGLASAQARLTAATEGPTTADIAAAAQSVASAKGQVTTAQKNLDDLKTKPTPSDLLTAQQAVLTAQNALRTANDNVAKARIDVTSAQNDVVSATNKMTTACGAATPTPTGCLDAQLALAKAQTAVATAQNSLNNGNLARSIQNAQAGLDAAQQKYQETLAGPKPADILAAQSSLDAAQASAVAAQARYDELFQAPKPDVVLPLQAAVEQARALAETARKALAAATITAPFDGQISQLNGEVGTQIASNTVVFILLNPRFLRIDANVDQAYVSDLRVNQTANVTFDALPGRTYQAMISAVGLTPTVQQGVVNYIVTLSIDTTRIPSGTPLPTPGMTASINITTNRIENALAVPVRAVRRIGRNQTLTVKTADGSEQRTVTTGATNGTLIQILTGLQDGEEVLVNTPAAAPTQQRTPGQTFPFP